MAEAKNRLSKNQRSLKSWFSFESEQTTTASAAEKHFFKQISESMRFLNVLITLTD